MGHSGAKAKPFGQEEMKFIIHRGAKEIGGICIEVIAGRTRIILDVGLPLDYPQETAIARSKSKAPLCQFPSNAPHVPKVPGLFQQGPRVDAILLSHAHADHAGLLNRAKPDIPVFCTQGTSKMLMAGAIFARQVELPRTRQKTIVPLRPRSIGDMVVTAYPVDHSAFDSVAYLVEADGKRLLFTGDLRLHGRKPGMARQLLKAVSSKPLDVLLMEGTHFSSEREAGWMEKELEAALCTRLRARPGLVLANFSPMHVDRMVSFYRAARRCDRVFVVDPYAAFVLHMAAGQCQVPTPEIKNGIRVYYNQHFERSWKARHLGKIHNLFLNNRIELETIVSQPDDYLMVCRPSMVEADLQGTFPTQSTWIYSYWKGYLDQPGSEYPRLRARLEGAGGEFLSYHTSGHIFAQDIETFLNHLNPNRVVPIHTTGSGEFQKRFKNVKLVEDGEVNSV
jgi:ribonuclease J